MSEIKKNSNKILDAILWCVLGAVIGGAIMLWKQDSIVSYLFQVHESRFTKFSSIDYLLQNEYMDQDTLNSASGDMIEGALAGYVGGLNDPYTVYLKEEENTELENELQNDAGFAGIGAVISKSDESYATISEVIKKSPAANAGLLPLDKIYMVDNKSLEGLTVNEVVDLIRGEKGSEVNLLIHRDSKDGGSGSQFLVTITRDDVTIPSVTSEIIQEQGKNIVYLEVSIISNHTTALLLEELNDALDKLGKIDGIILDLRGNSGGYLEEAIKLLGHFFPKNTVVCKSKYKAYADIDHKSEGKGELANYPSVVLVDQLTASAGEIIALTLQENGTPVIGMQTFGKGTIQTVEDFKDGSSLKFTIGKRYSPSDVSIDKVGITPNIEVERDYDSYKENGIDNQLETAKDELIKIIDK